MFIRICLLTVLVALAAFATPIKRDSDAAATVMDDLANLNHLAQSLGGMILTFSNDGTTPENTSGISDTALMLDEALVKATNDINASPTFDKKTTQTLLNCLGSYVQAALNATNEYIKATIKYLLILVGLQASDNTKGTCEKFQHDFNAFFAAILAKTPVSMAGQVQAQSASVNNAIAQYCS